MRGIHYWWLFDGFVPPFQIISCSAKSVLQNKCRTVFPKLLVPNSARKAQQNLSTHSPICQAVASTLGSLPCLLLHSYILFQKIQFSTPRKVLPPLLLVFLLCLYFPLPIIFLLVTKHTLTLPSLRWTHTFSFTHLLTSSILSAENENKSVFPERFLTEMMTKYSSGWGPKWYCFYRNAKDSKGPKM